MSRDAARFRGLRSSRTPEAILPDTMPLPPLTAWVSVALRVTAFPNAGFRPQQVSWWAGLTGTEPENRTARPRVGEFVDEGPFGGGKLVLRIQSERIDWNLLPREEALEGALDLPSLGTYPEALKAFLSVMPRWLDLAPPLTRLAYGAVLLQAAPDRRASYLQIMKYLHVVTLDPERSSDFLLQINHPRPSRVLDVEINRLMKWSAVRLGRLSFRVGGRSSAPMGITPVAEQYACRLELDINTSPEYDAELPRDRRHDLLSELVELGSEIAAKGDVM